MPENANTGLVVHPLFVAVTRPPMRFGVTDLALIGNGMLTMELFLVSKNPLTLLIALPIHVLCVAVCAQDARFFDLGLLWVRTTLPSVLMNRRVWRSSSYSALLLDPAALNGRRACPPTVYVGVRHVG